MSDSVSTPSVFLGNTLVSEVRSGQGGGYAYRAAWPLNGKLAILFGCINIFPANYLVIRTVGVTYSTTRFRSTCPICWESTRGESRYSKRVVVQRLRMGLASMLRKGLSIIFNPYSDSSLDSLSLITTNLSSHTLAVYALLGIAFPLMVFKVKIYVGVCGS